MLELEDREWRVSVETEGFFPSVCYGTAPGEAGIAFIPPCSTTCHLVPESVPLLAIFFFFKKVSAVLVKLLLVMSNSRHREGF